MGWIRQKLRGVKVFARVRADGRLDVDPQGRVDIRYQDAPGAKVYRAAERNLTADEGDSDGETDSAARPRGRATRARGRTSAPGREDSAQTLPSARGADGGAPTRARAEHNAVLVYTDGACSGNPGPAGLGVVVLDRGKRTEYSASLGLATNNIAELGAIEYALDALVSQSDRAIVIHTDSSYSIGVLAKDFRAKKNRDLIERIRAKLAQFTRVRFVKVEGHAGVPENERADELARQGTR